MIDNQPDSNNIQPDTAPASQSPVSTKENEQTTSIDFSRLTHQNWLFINSFLNTGNVRKAYQLAKYEGTEESAPYQVFRRMKPYIESIGDLDVTSRARLQADLKPLLNLPLEETKQSVTLKEKLEILKLAAKITPEAMQSKPQLSVLVINRPAKSEGERVKDAVKVDNSSEETAKPITTQLDSSISIIDAEIIK